MKELAEAFWRDAREALLVAKHDLPVSPKAAASRAYYAAFYAVSALFALRGQVFQRHTAVEAAVHRDLVRPGQWSTRLGEGYSKLLKTRSLSDYAPGQDVTPQDAQKAVATAAEILRAVAEAHPETFTGLAGG